MNIVVCMDSWKGSLTAVEACEAVKAGLLKHLPDAHIFCAPMADGGEGTLSVIASQRPGDFVALDVTGPLPDRRVRANYLYWPAEREAFVEMAVCAGLPLLAAHEKNPLRTTTRGVGELIADAVQRGASKIYLAAGGSATVDAGTGMAAALGWRFLDAAGNDLPDGGGALGSLARMVPPQREDGFPELHVFCDVTNPLLGPRGAARVFGPQKGADARAVGVLEEGLSRFAACCERDVGAEISTLPGGGAAGGIAAGAVAMFGAALVSGVDAVMEMTGLEEQIAAADWVVTGEGRFDEQSLDGKVVSGVLRLAKARRVPVAVVAGSCAASAEAVRAAGISAALSANARGLPLEEALFQAAELATAAGARLAEKIKFAPE